MMTAEQLKNSILQLALQGRLVEQSTEDESAQKLLERIRAAKRALIKAGTVPKDKKMEEVSVDDQLFDLPENWIWTRMGELFQHNTGKALNGTNKDGEVLTYITTSNLYWNRFELDNLKSMPFTESEVEKCTVTKGDLLVCEGGDYGRAAIWNYDFGMRIQNHVHRLRAYLPLCTEYYYYVINFLKGTGLIKGKGIAIQGLSSGALHNLAVPLPPLEEQKRIVAKIEELMPFVEQYAKASTRLNTLNASFRDQMKKSILQQAVMGKLVPQDPNDEPASVLLKKIAEEKQKLIKEGKIKKQKSDYSYSEEDIPFDIPDTWAWARLGSICHDLRYGTSSKSSPVGDVIVLRMGNIQNGEIDYADLAYSSNQDDNEKYWLEPMDILFNRTNSRELVGKTGIYRCGHPAIFAGYLVQVRPILVDPEYLNFVMNSEYERNYCKDVKSDGINQANVNATKIGHFLIPIPPINEQRRIVERLNGILPAVATYKAKMEKMTE